MFAIGRNHPALRQALKSVLDSDLPNLVQLDVSTLAGVLAERDEAIIAAVTEELQEIAGITARPRFTRIARWPRSMAQYSVGHAQRVEELEARVAGIPGLHLAGNAYSGIGIPDCIRMGKLAAEKILAG